MVAMNLPPLLANVDAEHLDIPLQTITSYCFFPIKWLRYVGWAIFHTEGSVSRQPQGAPLSDEAPLEDNDVLYFVVSGESFRAGNGGIYYLLTLLQALNPAQQLTLKSVQLAPISVPTCRITGLHRSEPR